MERSTTSDLISDNAKQFKVVKTTLDKAWRKMVTSSEVSNYSVRQKNQWKFVVELAPWMGEFYERLVGIRR